MANIRLEFPIWVRYHEGQYHVRPMLMAEPRSTGSRLERALKGLTKAVKNTFKQFSPDRDNQHQLFWFMFQPEYRFDQLTLSFRYGKRNFEGRISIYWFEQMGQTIVGLPAFNNYLFIAANKQAKRADLVDEVILHLQQYARDYRRGHDEELQMNDFTAGKGEYCTTHEVYLYVKDQKVSLEPKEEDIFRQFFGQETSFEGYLEINKVGQDLNDHYPSELSRAYYAEEGVEHLRQLLYNRERIPIVLLGPRKAGKTTRLHEAIYRYIQQNDKKELHFLDTIWLIDPARVIAGMSGVGMWQRRMESIIEYAKKPITKRDRQDKLYVDNVIALFRIGKSGQNDMTLSDVLKPHIQNRELQVVLEATPEEWDVAAELDRGFTDLFKVIRVGQPSEETALRTLNRLRGVLEYEHTTIFTNEGLSRLINLYRQFNRKDAWLGGMAEHMRELATKFANRTIDDEAVLHAFTASTHLNQTLVDAHKIIEKNTLEAHFDQRLIGQPQAIGHLVDMLHTLKARLNDPERPLGSFLFIGPTGVGKTEAAKVLAEYLFIHDERLVRFDMNEFIDAGAIVRLVGDLTHPEGQLTSKIRYNPFCVLLFDEIEKAHPDVHNLLLQVLGEGRLTDALGRTANFCQTVIIMTSNLGASRVGREITLTRKEEAATSTYQKAIKDFFRPEFINRIDKVVIFNPLGAQDIAKIAWLQIERLLRRHGFLRRHTFLDISSEVLERIAERGFDAEMGGRALKRQIEKELTILLADQLAEISADHPVIFQIGVLNGELRPRITSLEHIPADPDPGFLELDEVKITPKHFEWLKETYYLLKNRILEAEETDEASTSFDLETAEKKFASLPTLLQIRQNLIEVEEKLNDILWEIQTRRKIWIAPGSFSIKTMARTRNRLDYPNETRYLKDLYNQLQVNEYLKEIADMPEAEMNDSQAAFLDLFRTIAWNHYLFMNYQEHGVDQVILRILSSRGSEVRMDMGTLRYVYGVMFPELEFLYDEEDECCIYITGPGVYHLLAQEAGYHLFFHSHQLPSALAVSVHLMKPGADPQHYVQQLREEPAVIKDESYFRKQVAHIVKLYPDYTNQSGQYASRRNMIDLRTGLILPIHASRGKLRHLLYSRFPESYKLSIKSIHENL